MIHPAIVCSIRGASLVAFLVAWALAGNGASADNSGPVPYLDIECRTAWTVPGETDDYLLGGLLVDASWDHEGNLCFVDYTNKDLKIFSRDGEFQRTIGREGEGPGESLDARRLLVADDGRLGLLQVFPARIVWLRPDGHPSGKLTMDNTLGSTGGYVAMPHAVQYHGASIRPSARNTNALIASPEPEVRVSGGLVARRSVGCATMRCHGRQDQRTCAA